MTLTDDPFLLFNCGDFLFLQDGPQKTRITASPATTLMEEGTLMLYCATESNPPARTVWKKQLANETVQNIVKNHTLTIPNVQFDDTGVYICEVTNEVTNKTEKRTVTVSVQGIKLDRGHIAMQSWAKMKCTSFYNGCIGNRFSYRVLSFSVSF